MRGVLYLGQDLTADHNLVCDVCIVGSGAGGAVLAAGGEPAAELARLVREAYGSRARSSRLHPATRTFQALRIAVNDELGALDGLLSQVHHGAQAAVEDRPSWLTPGSRVALITFHSLEDRRVKQAFADMVERNHASQTVRKPLVASDSEIAANPRARSAKLRVATVGVPKD